MNKSKAVIEDFAEIPMWGEISNGALKNLWFENDGNAVKFKITEQFEKSNLKICAAVGTNCGQFNIYVNGKLKSSQDLFSSNLGMTNPLINLGENEPVENAFIIKFVYNGHNKSARTKNKKYALGLDYFIIENNFLKR
ncbi:MAG: hypothetical protein J7L95_01160 [Prolixibacteraceae bacterium]|nr:hypothetical protein [Prolixibacteraceae bacterium]